ncbi:MAG: TRAP transporter small permease [Alphaproteobacteria bacterium HGW-Alphaproteobacteria-6]|nr:MAG: TRAP transporter small permease [Alphaproteobacteria bacterium HGW-Alphaproteobacteria-6]
MQHRLHQLAEGLGLMARAALWLSGLCLTVMTALVAWQVFARYILDAPSTWTEPLSILMMGWFIFLGAAVGIREGYHLSFDVLLHVLPARVVLVLHTVSDVAVLGFGVGMIVYGGELMAGTWATAMPTLGLPTGLALLPVVLGGVLVVVFSAERLVRRAAGLPTARFGDDSGESVAAEG